MAWPAWSVGDLPLDTAGFPQAPWAHLVGSLPRLHRKLRLALPCIGLDGLGAGLRALRWTDYEIIYAFDVDDALLAPLLAMHGPIGLGGNIRIGSSGDIMTQDIEAWERVDLLVSGPPCPPWSQIGARQGANDPREQVFQRVTAAITHQGRLGCYGFIVEMVEGMDHTSNRSRGPSYYSCWLEQLKREAPMFLVKCWPMNTAHFLPQSRSRLYTVGFHRNLLLGDSIPPPLHPSMPAVPLNVLLHKGLKPIDDDRLSYQLRSNLVVAQRMVHDRHLKTPTGLGGVVACIAVDRCPQRAWGIPVRYDGLVSTLRTENEHIWLYQLDVAGKRVLLSRCLHPVERLALQGFPVELGKFLSKSDLLRATGNSFSVPVVTCVFRQWLLLAMRAYALELPSVERPRRLAEDELMKRLCLNEERHQVALVERLAQLASHKRRRICNRPPPTGRPDNSLPASKALDNSPSASGI